MWNFGPNNLNIFLLVIFPHLNSTQYIASNLRFKDSHLAVACLRRSSWFCMFLSERFTLKEKETKAENTTFFLFGIICCSKFFHLLLSLCFLRGLWEISRVQFYPIPLWNSDYFVICDEIHTYLKGQDVPLMYYQL